MIGKNLVSLRKQHKMSQEEVAEAVQVSRQAVAKWENGDSIPDAINCISLARLYQVTVDDLLTFDEEATNLGISIPPKGKHFFGLAKLGDRGQIVIPQKARKIFDLKQGDELMVLGDEEQGIALVKADKMMKFIHEIYSVVHKKE